QAPLPGGREIERRNQGGKQSDVAHAGLGRGKSVMRGRIEPERQHLRIRRGGVLAAERLDAGLQEFPASVRAMPEYPAEIAKTARLAGGGGPEIGATRPDG